MAISANISAAEVTSSVSQRYVGQYFEAALINAPGITYSPGTTTDSTFLAFEAPWGWRILPRSLQLHKRRYRSLH